MASREGQSTDAENSKALVTAKNVGKAKTTVSMSVRDIANGVRPSTGEHKVSGEGADAVTANAQAGK